MAIGLGQNTLSGGYFCTPRRAKIIGCAGVDGIHYCQIKDFGDMIFAVSPMNPHGENVHPIAESFEKLLALLLACGSMDAIEQAYMWNDEAQFDEYIKNCQPYEEQTIAFEAIKTQLGILPDGNPYAYIKKLQTEFDYSKIPFSKEYYDICGQTVFQPPEWKVVFEGGFFPNSGRKGKEISVKKQFDWGGQKWYIPSVYICSGGIVVDLLAEVDADSVRAFKVRQTELGDDFERIIAENPFFLNFRTVIELNGVNMKERGSCSDMWNSFDEDSKNDHSKRIFEHYGCDLSVCWSIYRVSIPWVGERPHTLKSMVLTLKRSPIDVYGEPLRITSAGESFEIINPINGAKHLLTVHGFKPRKMNGSDLPSDAEYPTNAITLSYSLCPDADGFRLSDKAQSDAPRNKEQSQHDMTGVSFVMIPKAADHAVAENPDGTAARIRDFTSSLHFESVSELNVDVIFSERANPTVTVEIQFI